MVPYILIGTAILIVVSIGMANVLSARYSFSLVTAFLAMAPGGIAEMSLAGMSMGEKCFDYPDLSAGACAGDKYLYPAAAGMVV